MSDTDWHDVSIGGNKQLNCKKYDSECKKTHLSESDNQKEILGERAQLHPQTSAPHPQCGRGHPLPTPDPLRRLNTRAYGARPWRLIHTACRVYPPLFVALHHCRQVRLLSVKSSRQQRCQIAEFLIAEVHVIHWES